MDGQYLKIYCEGYMPLTIELISTDIKTPFGDGKQYSFCHYYEQNGVLMRNPEMCFVVVDNRVSEINDPSMVGIYPTMYQQDNLGIYEESIHIEGNTMKQYFKSRYNDHCVFANQWLSNIKQQGFL